MADGATGFENPPALRLLGIEAQFDIGLVWVSAASGHQGQQRSCEENGRSLSQVTIMF